jgi:hypothetical protein
MIIARARRACRLATWLAAVVALVAGVLAVSAGGAVAGSSTSVMATAPTFTDPQCTDDVHVKGSVTIPSEANVQYSLHDSITVSGTLNVADGGTIQIDATATNGATLTGTTTWSHTFTSVTCQTLADTPGFTDDACSGPTATGASYVVPDEPGVTYQLDGESQDPGSYPATDGSSITLTVLAQAGYVLASDSQTSFSHTFGAAPDCHTKITPNAPIFVDDVCTDDGPTGATYTIPTTDGLRYGVQINGGNIVTMAAGTYAIPDGSTVIIGVATTAANEEITGTDVWTHTFAGPPCSAEVQEPTFLPGGCAGSDLVGAATDLPDTDGIDYYLNGAIEPPGEIVPADFGSTVTVTAQPEAGFTLTGQTTFTHTYGAQPDCTTHVTATEPVFTDNVCTSGVTDGASYTIPAEDGVDYLIGSDVVTSGTYSVADGTSVTITTEPQNGFSLDGTTSFSHVFTATPVCPTITAKVMSRVAPTKYGWYRTPVTVTFTCSAGSSSLAAGCPGPVSLSDNGVTTGLTRSIDTVDGSTATVTVPTIRLDQSPPAAHVTGAVSGRTYKHPRHLACVARDKLAGLAGSCVVRTHRVAHRHFTAISYVATATDRAGNRTVVRGHYRVT